jgi:hypothetical protein
LTDSGLRLYQWIMRLVALKEKQGLSDGPGNSDEKGRVLNSANIDQAMHEVFEEFFIQHCDLFPTSVTSRKTSNQIITPFDHLEGVQTLGP